jgi:hypothetical protein
VLPAAYPRVMRLARPVALSSAGLVLALLALPGCDTQVSGGGGGESGVVGRNCTVELRPVRINETEVLHKQRSGTLQKLTSDWVMLYENNNEIWIPRDMVLELRMEKK